MKCASIQLPRRKTSFFTPFCPNSVSKCSLDSKNASLYDVKWLVSVLRSRDLMTSPWWSSHLKTFSPSNTFPDWNKRPKMHLHHMKAILWILLHVWKTMWREKRLNVQLLVDGNSKKNVHKGISSTHTWQSVSRVRSINNSQVWTSFRKFQIWSRKVWKIPPNLRKQQHWFLHLGIVSVAKLRVWFRFFGLIFFPDGQLGITSRGKMNDFRTTRIPNGPQEFFFFGINKINRKKQILNRFHSPFLARVF